MSDVKLTTLQRTTLEAAAVRSNYVAWPIRNGKLNPGSEARVIKRLMAMGLVVEKPAIAKAPVWRENGQGQPLMAVVSEAGLEAIGMLPVGKAGRYRGRRERRALSLPRRRLWRPYRTASRGCRGRARNWQRWSDCWNAMAVQHS